MANFQPLANPALSAPYGNPYRRVFLLNGE